jgi:chromosome segregation ATPase
MSEDKGIAERVAKVETAIQYHEQRMNKLEGSLNDLSHKIQEIIINQNALLEKFNTLSASIETIQTNLTMRGVKWFLEKMALPIAIAIAVSMILKFF